MRMNLKMANGNLRLLSNWVSVRRLSSRAFPESRVDLECELEPVVILRRRDKEEFE